MSTLTLSKTQKYTYQDYLHFDDDTRYEIIEGELEMVPGPSLDHQSYSRNLEFLLWNFVRENDLGEIYDAPIDVVLNDDNVVQPDIVFVSKKNAEILQKQAIVGSPDLIVEILSPSSVHKDRYRKKSLYEKFGVEEYWIVDPGNNTIEVFCLKGDHFELHAIASEKGSIKSKIIKGFEANLEEIF